MEDKSKLIPCLYAYFWGFPGVSFCLQCRRLRFDPWVRKIPWRRKWQPTPVFVPGEFHRQRSLAGYSSWGRKTSRTGLKHPSTAHMFISGLPRLPACLPPHTVTVCLTLRPQILQCCSDCLFCTLRESSWRPFFCAHSLNKCC